MPGSVLQYEGKRVIVSGAATGIGIAIARILVELGAEVHATDLEKPDVDGLASFTACDLRDPRQIDDTVKKIGKVVNALFNCACAPATSANLDVMLTNFSGTRHLTESVIANMIEGSAIASTTATTATVHDTSSVFALLATRDADEARAWCDAYPDELDGARELAGEAINAYTVGRSSVLAQQHIRINCVNAPPSVAETLAWPLVFLNSPRASSITGQRLDLGGGVTPAS